MAIDAQNDPFNELEDANNPEEEEEALSDTTTAPSKPPGFLLKSLFLLVSAYFYLPSVH
jgi:hypothetical protein